LRLVVELFLLKIIPGELILSIQKELELLEKLIQELTAVNSSHKNRQLVQIAVPQT
jgi:hypothetical protein